MSFHQKKKKKKKKKRKPPAKEEKNTVTSLMEKFSVLCTPLELALFLSFPQQLCPVLTVLPAPAFLPHCSYISLNALILSA